MKRVTSPVVEYIAARMGESLIRTGACFSQAATFPVAGLTALHALARGGLVLGRQHRPRHRAPFPLGPDCGVHLVAL